MLPEIVPSPEFVAYNTQGSCYRRGFLFLQLGRPDVLIIGVGGGSKIFNGEEAAEVVRTLNPRRVIPVQYVNGDAPEGCDQEGVQPFLDAMGGTAIRRVGRTQNLPSDLDDTTVITVMQ